MGILRQILVTLVVLLVAAGLWMTFDPRPGQAVLESELPIPKPVRSLVAAISAKAEPGAAKVAGTPSGGGGRGGGGRGGGAAVVVAGTVETAVTRTQMRAIGTGEAERSVSVYPDVTGIIRSVGFRSGDEVAIGSVLAVLEDDAEVLAVDRARIALSTAEEKVARVERLQASRAVTAVEAIEAGRLRETAELDLRAAEIALAKRTIRAPIAGRVGIVGVDTGDLVNNQALIATIDDRARIKVNFFTPEAFVQELSIGEAIEATSVARPDKLYAGRISALESRLDEASRTLRTEATIDNPNDELRPGMSFVISLALPGDRHLAVDPLAVQWERMGPIVWRIQGDEVAKAKVRIVERTIDKVLVASEALKAGDEVVVEGLQSVREGGKVEVQNRPTAKGVPTADGSAAQGPELAEGTPAGATPGTAAR